MIDALRQAASLQATRDEIRRKIDVGWEQMERGEGRDGETVFAELDAALKRRLADRQRSSTTKTAPSKRKSA